MTTDGSTTASTYGARDHARSQAGQVVTTMPVLPASAWTAWLAPTPPDPGELLALLRPAPDDLLERYPVSRRVNSARNEGSDLVVPLGPLGPGPGTLIPG